MSKLCVVTSVYNIRKTRPLEYYLTPTIDLIDDMSGSDVEICVFTDQCKDKFGVAENIRVFNYPPDFFIKSMWDDADWRNKYLTKRANSTGEVIPELISIWLGKFMMMQMALNSNVDRILWQDSGIRGHFFKHYKSQRYKKKKLYPSVYNASTQNLLEKHKIVLMHYQDLNNVIQHGVDMTKYNTKKSMMAGLMLCDASEIHNLAAGIKQKWNLLIENDDYGTEETALSLYYSENENRIGTMIYPEWVDCLRLISTKRIYM